MPRSFEGACYTLRAIDDQTAIKVINGVVEVVSEGHWKWFSLTQIPTDCKVIREPSELK